MATALGDPSARIAVRESSLVRVLKNSGWLLGSSALTAGISLVQGLLAARVLGVENFGIFALITASTQAANQFVDSRVWATAIHFVTKYGERGEPRRAAAVVKLCYIIDAVTAVLAVGFLLGVADIAAVLLIKDVSAGHLIRLYSALLLLVAPVGTSSALLRMANRFQWLAYHQSGVAALRLFGTALMLPFGLDLGGLLCVYLVSAMMGTIAILVLAKRAAFLVGIRGVRSQSLASLRGQFREITRFFISTNLQSTCKLFQTHGVILVIGYLLNPVAVGYYQLANRIAGMIGILAGPVTASSYPEFSKLWHSRRTAGLAHLVFRLTLILSVIAVTATAGLALFGRFAITVFLGEEFLPALPVMHLLAIAMGMAVASNSGTPLLLAIGRPATALIAMTCGVLGQFLLLWTLVPTMGIVAAGISQIAFYGIWLAIVLTALHSSWRRATL